MRSHLLALLALAAVPGCREGPPPPDVRIVSLPAPGANQPAREPHLAIDPDNPARVIVAAQYGEGYNRGGHGIWSWVSSDDGRTWEGRNIPLPRHEATLAADAVTAFGSDGRGLLLFVYADSVFRGGAALTRTGPDDLLFGPTSIAVQGDLDASGAVDKPWLVLDRNRLSPFHGAAYLSYHHMKPGPGRTVQASLWIRRGSLDASWDPPVQVSRHTGGQLAVRTSGTLDVVFVADDERTLLHARSDDGGRTFATEPIVAMPSTDSTTHIAMATLAAMPADSLLACWVVDGPGDTDALGTYCARGFDAGGWERPARIGAEGRSLWFPALAASGGTAWLAGYTTDSAATRVELLRSTDGGRSFSPHRILASRAFGADRFCRAPGAACRRDSTYFFPGDYFAVATGPARVGVALTMPETDDALSRPTIYVSLIRPE